MGARLRRAEPDEPGGPLALVAHKRHRPPDVDPAVDLGMQTRGVKLRWVQRRSGGAGGDDASEVDEEHPIGGDGPTASAGTLVLDSFEVVPLPAQLLDEPQPDAKLFAAAASLLASLIAATPASDVVVTTTVPLVPPADA